MEDSIGTVNSFEKITRLPWMAGVFFVEKGVTIG